MKPIHMKCNYVNLCLGVWKQAILCSGMTHVSGNRFWLKGRPRKHHWPLKLSHSLDILKALLVDDYSFTIQFETFDTTIGGLPCNASWRFGSCLNDDDRSIAEALLRRSETDPGQEPMGVNGGARWDMDEADVCRIIFVPPEVPMARPWWKSPRASTSWRDLRWLIPGFMTEWRVWLGDVCPPELCRERWWWCSACKIQRKFLFKPICLCRSRNLFFQYLATCHHCTCCSLFSRLFFFVLGSINFSKKVFYVTYMEPITS